jgi:para-aminobenzoate synthetase/4-amino-4-deoxychorismate lyase
VLAKARVLRESRPAFSLFETVRHDPDEGFGHLPEHLDRLAASARYFGFRFDPEAAVAALKSAAAEHPAAPTRIRLTLGRDGVPDVEASAMPAAPAGPVRLAIDEEPVDPRDVWLYHKTTRRAPYDRRRGRRPDVDDVVLVNDRGEVTETTIANLAVRLDGRWVTPPLGSGLLAGCYRAVLLADGTLEEAAVSLETFRAAEEVAVISSVRGWRPAEVVR